MDGFERSGNFIANPGNPTNTEFMDVAGGEQKNSDDDEPTATVHPHVDDSPANQSITDPHILDPTNEDDEQQEDKKPKEGKILLIDAKIEPERQEGEEASEEGQEENRDKQDTKDDNKEEVSKH